MRARSFVTWLIVAISIAPAMLTAQSPAADPAARDVYMTVGDDMKFNVETVHATSGERLRVVLRSVGVLPRIAMAHNFVLLAGGTDPIAFINDSIHAVPPDFMPPNMRGQVLAATPLAGPGETVEVTFTVPEKPGRYIYLCAYPGHYASGARGFLIVSRQTERRR